MNSVEMNHQAPAIGLPAALRRELDDGILKHWLAMQDFEAGGYFCWQRQDGGIEREGEKSTLLHARILYSFARAFRVTGEPRYFDAARQAYDWLTRYTIKGDRVIWAADCHGNTTDDLNHMYNQGFVIYSLAAWGHASGDAHAIEQALTLWQAVEGHAFDRVHGGYHEAFDTHWNPISNNRLCDTEDGVVTDKSMNTHLHLLEAWTELYKVAPGPALADRMAHLIDILTGPLLDRKTYSFHLFTAADWTVHSASRSFGHDIEGSWLIWEAARLLSPLVQNKARPTVIAMADRAVAGLDANGALWNELNARGEPDRRRVWWVQAEALVGFVNTFELTGDAVWLDRAQAVWRFIEQHQRDPGGEWYWELDERNRPNTHAWRIEPWKCPYHNSRMCLEVLERLKE